MCRDVECTQSYAVVSVASYIQQILATPAETAYIASRTHISDDRRSFVQTMIVS